MGEIENHHRLCGNYGREPARKSTTMRPSWVTAASVHDEVRIFWVLGYKQAHGRTDNVDLEIVLARVLESSFCQRSSQPEMTQLFGYFGMDQFQDARAQTIFKVGDGTVLLDFEASSCHHLVLRLVSQDSSPDAVAGLPSALSTDSVSSAERVSSSTSHFLRIAKIVLDPNPARMSCRKMRAASF